VKVSSRAQKAGESGVAALRAYLSQVAQAFVGSRLMALNDAIAELEKGREAYARRAWPDATRRLPRPIEPRHWEQPAGTTCGSDA
jgi:hypothetical protein